MVFTFFFLHNLSKINKKTEVFSAYVPPNIAKEMHENLHLEITLIKSILV